ncbi:MAG: hypothetical protein ACI8XO_002910 [Verrucomicrobiales bacterium]|jgi:hypothetical protein
MKQRKLPWLAAMVSLTLCGISTLTRAETLDSINHYGNARTVADGGTASATSAGGIAHGFTNPATDTYTITTGGADLWGGADNGSAAFDSAAPPREGDFSAIVRCRIGEAGEVLAGGGWGRTGIMARKSTGAANSANFAHYRRSDGARGSVFGIRQNDGAGTLGNDGPSNHGNGAATIPHQTTWIWLGLHRKGTHILTSWAPDDGAGSPSTWSDFIIRSATPDNKGPVHVGLAHQNHNTAGDHNSGAFQDGGKHISTATFEQFQVFGEFNPAFGVLPAPILPAPGTIAAEAGGPGTFGVREITAVGTDIFQARDALINDTGGLTGQFAILDVTDPDTNVPGGPVLGGTPTPFLSDVAGDTNDIKTIATGELNVQKTDFYTFNFHGDDGFAARIVGSEWLDVAGAGSIDVADASVVYFPNGTGDHNTQALVWLEAGIHDFEYIHWEGGGGAYYEVSSHSGNLLGGGPAQWLALGDGTQLAPLVLAGSTPVALSGPVDVYKLNGGGNAADPGGGDGAAPSRFQGAANDGIRAQIQAAIGSNDPNLNQNTHPDTYINENETPNPAQNDDYRLRVSGEFVVDNGNAILGESLDLTFTMRTDDGSQLRIIGQSFTGVAGDGRTFLEDVDGDMSLTGDFFTGNTNALGHINLVEGTYQFESYMFEGGGGSRFELQAAAGTQTDFTGFVIPAAPTLVPGNCGIAVGKPELVISTVLPPLPYAQDFDGFADGTTVLGDGSQMNGTASVQGGALRLTTDGIAGGFASFNIPGLPNSSSGWTASFDLTIIDSAGSNPPADGMSFNYGGFGLGELGSAEEGMAGAGGVNENVSFEIDTWMNFDAEQGVNIAEKVGGVDTNLAFTNGPILNDGTTVGGQVTMSWNPTDGASFSTNGLLTNAAFSNVVTTFAANDAHLFGFSGRVGGANETKLIDNLVIQPDVGIEGEIASGTCIDFGTTRRDLPVTKDFTVSNTGSEDLIFTGLTLPPDWSLVGTPPAPIPAGGSAVVTVQFDGTGSAGDRMGTISLDNNDCDEDPFEIVVKACLDDQGPVITGAKDLVANAPAGGLSDPIEWTLTAIDNKDPDPSLICTPPSGTQFPIGDNEVVCVATDNVGNETTTSFFVSVLEIADTPGERFLDIVSLRGEEALGAGGAGTGIPAGATIFTYYNAYINNDGDAIVRAALSGAPGADRALFKANGSGLTELLAVRGGTSPFGGTYSAFADEALSDDGVASFTGSVGTTDGHVADDGAGATGVAFVGGAAADTGGATFRALRQLASAGANGIYSPGYLTTGGAVTVRNDTGIWRSTSGLVAREGDPAAGFGPAPHGHVFNRVVTNASGDIAFAGSVLTRPSGAAVWAGSPAMLSVIAQKAAAAPGTTGAFRSFAAESIGGGGDVAIRATLVTQTGIIGSDNNEGIWTNRSGSLELVAREGDVAPCLPTTDALFGRFDTMSVADDGSVCFFAYLKGPGVNSSNDGSFWRSTGDGILHLIVREGAEANNTDGAVHSTIHSVACNNSGGAVYSTRLVRGVGDTASSNDFGLWLDKGSERAAELVLREGDKFPLAADERTVTFIGFDQTTNAAGGTGGYGRVVNDSGEIMLRLSLDGNLSGLFILGEE